MSLKWSEVIENDASWAKQQLASTWPQLLESIQNCFENPTFNNHQTLQILLNRIGQSQYTDMMLYLFHLLFHYADNLQNPYAQYLTGVFYQKCFGGCITKDLSLSFYWCHKSMLQGNPFGYAAVAFNYEQGYGCEQDFQKSLEYYEKAIELGNPLAMLNMGLNYMSGESGVSKDSFKTIDLFNRAIEAGSSQAMSVLAGVYLSGSDAVPQDIEKGVDLLQKAVKMENASAMKSLAILYEKGQGVEKNPEYAFQLNTKAAEQNNSKAMVNLGVMYYFGTGVQENIAKSIELFLDAAAEGEGQAETNLCISFCD